MSDRYSVRGLGLCALLALVSLCATATAADDPGARAPIVIWTVNGDVHATSGARDIPLKAGLDLQLPVSIRVGADGALEMHQGATVVSAAANSQLQIPKATSSDQTLDRIVQSEGNVYYNVAKRPAHKLRIETPLLVAVIKGTRFNVSAADTMTTISLLEGSIEVHASDDTSVVDLSAGQMATRSHSQPAIRVIRMTTGEVIHGPAPEVAAAIAAGQRVDHALQGQGRSKDEVPRPAALIAISPNSVIPAVSTSALATGVASGQGDDHGASSSLTLNQLVTHATSAAGASNMAGSSAGTSVDTGTSGANAGSLGADTGAAGSNGGSLGSGAGTSGTSGGTLGTGAGTSGAGGGSVGAGAGTSGTGASGTAGGSVGPANTGTGSTPSLGSSASGASGTGSASSSGAANGNANGSGNGNAGTASTPGNSGITVTPGSGPGTSSASNSGSSGGGSSNGQGTGSSNGQGSSGSSGPASGSSNSSSSSNGSGNSSNSNGQGPGNLNAALQSLLNKKKK